METHGLNSCATASRTMRDVGWTSHASVYEVRRTLCIFGPAAIAGDRSVISRVVSGFSFKVIPVALMSPGPFQDVMLDPPARPSLMLSGKHHRFRPGAGSPQKSLSRLLPRSSGHMAGLEPVFATSSPPAFRSGQTLPSSASRTATPKPEEQALQKVKSKLQRLRAAGLRKILGVLVMSF